MGASPPQRDICRYLISKMYVVRAISSLGMLRSLEQDNVKAFMFENSRSIASTGSPSNDKNTSTLRLIQYYVVNNTASRLDLSGALSLQS